MREIFEIKPHEQYEEELKAGMEGVSGAPEELEVLYDQLKAADVPIPMSKKEFVERSLAKLQQAKQRPI